jgi:hypothetical protein
MIVHARFAAIKGIKLHEWLIRFVAGGAICVIAGLIASAYGPKLGGLFLAFPAIFPAGASLVEAHEKQHKARIGHDGTMRGRQIAALDAFGAAIGCIGLAGFGMFFWLWTPHASSVVSLVLATLAWLTLAVGCWLLRRKLIPGHKTSGRVHPQ